LLLSLLLFTRCTHALDAVLAFLRLKRERERERAPNGPGDEAICEGRKPLARDALDPRCALLLVVRHDAVIAMRMES